VISLSVTSTSCYETLSPLIIIIIIVRLFLVSLSCAELLETVRISDLRDVSTSCCVSVNWVSTSCHHHHHHHHHRARSHVVRCGWNSFSSSSSWSLVNAVRRRRCASTATLDNLSDSAVVFAPSWSRDAVTSSADCSGMRTAVATSADDSGTTSNTRCSDAIRHSVYQRTRMFTCKFPIA